MQSHVSEDSPNTSGGNSTRDPEASMHWSLKTGLCLAGVMAAVWMGVLAANVQSTLIERQAPVTDDLAVWLATHRSRGQTPSTSPGERMWPGESVFRDPEFQADVIAEMDAAAASLALWHRIDSQDVASLAIEAQARMARAGVHISTRDLLGAIRAREQSDAINTIGIPLPTVFTVVVRQMTSGVELHRAVDRGVMVARGFPE